MGNDFYRKTVGDRVFTVVNIVVFLLFTILCIFPFYYLFINTISDNALVGANAITLLPKGIHFGNYLALKDVQDFGNAVMVTVSRTILATALMVLCSAFAGYLTTKREMWNRSFWYRALVITMYFNAGTIPWYLNMLGLGLTDNYLGYIIPAVVAPYNIILVKTYIESIPASLEESATIDGATTMQVFTKIIIPMCRPMIVYQAIVGFLTPWLDFVMAKVIARTQENYTASLGLWLMLDKEYINSWFGRFAAAAVLISIPIAILFIVMQRFYQESMSGAVKG